MRVSAVEVGDAEDDDILAEINITPLTDVFIVLLIIFMVAASASSGQGDAEARPTAEAALVDKLSERALEVQTPDGTGSTEIVKRDVVVSIHPDGTVFVDATETTMAALGTVLAELRADPEITGNLVVRGDRTSPYEMIVRVISIASARGFENVSLATQTQ